MKDELGDRMKDYEIRAKTSLPRRTYAIIRLDGKAFHTYTKTQKLKSPFDIDFAEDMNRTAQYLCENIQGAKFAYVQSDEISILITDFGKKGTEAWFDNKVQKMVSIASSYATARFNQLRLQRNLQSLLDTKLGVDDDVIPIIESQTLAYFDARIFSISEPWEVHNYFVWRQKDATKNSISMAAQSMFSSNQLHGKSGSEKQDMMMEKGTNWNDYPIRFRRGGFVFKETYMAEIDMSKIPEKHRKNIPEGKQQRTRWTIVDPPIFTKEKEFTAEKIPVKSGDGTITLLQIEKKLSI